MIDFVDTLLNIEVFAFIALLIWLYVKPPRIDRADDPGAASGTNTDSDP